MDLAGLGVLRRIRRRHRLTHDVGAQPGVRVIGDPICVTLELAGVYAADQALGMLRIVAVDQVALAQ